MIDMTLGILIRVLAAVLVVWVHELSKYYVSLTLLHPIHRKRADMKINPFSVIDPIGLILFVFSNVGWQKPKEYNMNKFRDKERAMLVLSVVGSLANLLLILAMIPIYFSIRNTDSVVIYQVGIFVYRLIQFSFAIIIVNLLPVPPLDMSKVIQSINIEFYYKLIQNQRIIHAVFILLIAFNILNLFVSSLFTPIFKLLV